MARPRRRLTVIALFALLCLGLLAGCGTNAPPVGPGTPTATGNGY